MSSATQDTKEVVPPEEVARRIAEYRRIGFERRLPPHVVYHAPYQLCPWPDCGLQINGADLRFDQMGDSAFQEQLLAAWWQGPGVIGNCPNCGRYVLFDVEYKKAVSDPGLVNAPVLPKDWHRRAYLAIPPARSG